MLNLHQSLTDLRETRRSTVSEITHGTSKKEAIAIIGIDAKAGAASNLSAIWNALREGYDMISALPSSRWEDARKMQYVVNGRSAQNFVQSAYLEDIDGFDADFFHMAPIEAEMMDPAHRIYLLSAQRALQDAGYGQRELAGTKTGVFVGYNSMSGTYWTWINDAPKETFGIQVPGNISSFLASRLSFYSDFQGPSMLIDTACSSSLVALYEACRALHAGEIETAIVGSIHLFVNPDTEDADIGTTSSTARTRSFDISADGTGSGEGVINIVLKPLSAARRDGDYVYAVIRGSAINQDGASLGLTAPNTDAQERLLCAAWDDAGIHPEEISYLEAHGTATKLGDPIELGGITAAFAKYTNKKQFCAIGSVKSNFGHLDCAAGLMGVLKVILMMQHRQLVPSIHFFSPNRELSFITSPVYLNDRCRAWETPSGRLLAGVSSFGMSGTNSHIVIESADTPESLNEDDSAKPLLYAVQAKNREHVMRIILADQAYMRNHLAASFADFCYSRYKARQQGDFRFACFFSDREAFLAFDPSGIQGSMVDEIWFEALKKPAFGNNVRRIPVPVLPFCEKRFWYERVNLKHGKEKALRSVFPHPLIQGMAFATKGLCIYTADLSVNNCMELREHCINGQHVLPGTVFVDFVMFLGKRHFGDAPFQVETLTFLTPFVTGTEEERQIHLLVQEEADICHITIQSQDRRKGWQVHVDAKLQKSEVTAKKKCSLSALMQGFTKIDEDKMKSNKTVENFLQLGEHWSLPKEVYKKEGEMLLAMQLPKNYRKEAERYTIYPSLLDHLVNGGLALLNGLYLPLNYSGMPFFRTPKGMVYSHIIRQQAEQESKEVELFHIDFYDAEGNGIGEIEEYALKRVHEAERFLAYPQTASLHQIRWSRCVTESVVQRKKNKALILIIDSHQLDTPLVKSLEEADAKVQYLIRSTKELSSSVLPDGAVVLTDCSETGIADALGKLRESPVENYVNLLCAQEDQGSIEDDIQNKMCTTFMLTRALLQRRRRQRVEMTFYTRQAYPVVESDVCQPSHQAIAGFASCIPYEDERIAVRVIDYDVQTPPQMLVKALFRKEDKLIVAYRNGQRYEQEWAIAKETERDVFPKGKDVVVMAGGYGGMGMAISRYIVQKSPGVRVVLLSRHGENAKEQSARHDALLRLREKGTKIDVLQADMTNGEEVSQALNVIRQRYGQIDHYYHLAGVAGDGFLLNKTWEKFYAVLAPKVLGSRYALEGLKEDHLKSIVFFSSLTSLTGAAGQSDYCAANAYLDALPFSRLVSAQHTLTINWTGWFESGMANRYQVNEQDAPYRFVSDAEGANLFARALSVDAHRVLAGVLKRNLLPEEYHEWERRIMMPNELKEPETPLPESEKTMDVQVYGKSPEQLTDVERNVAIAWANTLHVQEVNLKDKFFESGGNSLLATYLLKEIDRFYPDRMTITDIFLYSTIETMALYISQQLEQGRDPDEYQENRQQESTEHEEDMGMLLDKFMDGSLSLDQMEKLL